MEREIKIVKVVEFTYGEGKTGWNVFDEEERKYATFSSTIKAECDAAFVDEKIRKVEFDESERNGFMNRTITKIYDAEGKVIESSRKGGGGGGRSNFDPELSARQTALNAAVHYLGRKPDSKAAEIIPLAEGLLPFLKGGK